jgi:hypothetical protein
MVKVENNAEQNQNSLARLNAYEEKLLSKEKKEKKEKKEEK